MIYIVYISQSFHNSTGVFVLEVKFRPFLFLTVFFLGGGEGLPVIPLFFGGAPGEAAALQQKTIQ